MKNRMKGLLGLLVGAGMALVPSEGMAERVRQSVPDIVAPVVAKSVWQPEYQVTPSVSGEGSIVYEKSQDDYYPENKPLSLEAVAKTGSNFLGWSGQTNTTANPLVLPVNKPYTNLVAYFQTITPSNYLVRTLIEGNGTISPMNPSLPENGSTSFSANAVQPLHRIARIEQDGRVVYSNDGKLNDNSLTQTNFNYISNKGGLVKIVFEPKRIFLGGDFDGDGLADPVVHTEKGELKAFLSSTGYGKLEYDFQTRGNYPAIGDIDGDGMEDLAYLDDFGKWKVQLSGDNYQMIDSYNSGVRGTPLVGDFDRDGMADLGIQDINGKLYAYLSSTDSMIGPIVFNPKESNPTAGDLDGDRIGDIAYMDSKGSWKTRTSGSGYSLVGPYDLGVRGTPLLGDFDGDSLADPAVVDKNGNWYVWFSGSDYARGGPYSLGL